MTFSALGHRLSGGSGIENLMRDLGHALAATGSPAPHMLGGGNPAHIPEVEAVWRRRLGEILDTPGAMESMLGDSAGKLLMSSFWLIIVSFRPSDPVMFSLDDWARPAGEAITVYTMPVPSHIGWGLVLNATL